MPGTWYTINCSAAVTVTQLIEGETVELAVLDKSGTTTFRPSVSSITIETEGKYHVLPTKAPAAPCSGGNLTDKQKAELVEPVLELLMEEVQLTPAGTREDNYTSHGFGCVVARDGRITQLDIACRASGAAEPETPVYAKVWRGGTELLASSTNAQTHAAGTTLSYSFAPFEVRAGDELRVTYHTEAGLDSTTYLPECQACQRVVALAEGETGGMLNAAGGYANAGWTAKYAWHMQVARFAAAEHEHGEYAAAEHEHEKYALAANVPEAQFTENEQQKLRWVAAKTQGINHALGGQLTFGDAELSHLGGVAKTISLICADASAALNLSPDMAVVQSTSTVGLQYIANESVAAIYIEHGHIMLREQNGEHEYTLKGSEIHEHINDTHLHITAADRAKWDGKADEYTVGILQPQGDLAGCDTEVTAAAVSDGAKGGLFPIEGVVNGVKVCCGEGQTEGVEVGMTMVLSNGRRLGSDNTCIAGPGRELCFTFAELAECEREDVAFVIFVLPDKRGSNMLSDAVNLSVRGTTGQGIYRYTTPEPGEEFGVAVWLGVDVERPNFAPYGVVKECEELSAALAKQETALAEQTVSLRNLSASVNRGYYHFLALRKHPEIKETHTTSGGIKLSVRDAYFNLIDSQADMYMKFIEVSSKCTVEEVKTALKSAGLEYGGWHIVPLD